MTVALMTVVVVLIGVAIAVQVYYLRGLKRAGIDPSTATKVVSYVNIGLLVLVALGLLAFIAFGSLTAAGL